MAEENVIKVKQEDYENAIVAGYSEDLAPVTKEKRSYGFTDYFTLWMGSVHNIPNYAAVAGFLFLGIAPIHVTIALILSSFFVMALLIGNGKPGFKYGIPSTLVLRDIYGSTGAKLPGFLRGVIAAIGWYGLQTYTGSQALLILIGKFFPSFLEIGGGATFLGITIPGLICFTVFWIANLAIGLGGGDAISKLTGILTPLIYVLFIGMSIWAVNVGGGIGNILAYDSGVSQSYPTIFIYLMIISSVMSVWAAPGVSSSDFGKDGKSYRAFAGGQGLGLFLSYLLFGISSVLILTGGSIFYNTDIRSVLDIINNWDFLPAVAFASLVLLLSTISTNATGNIVPAGYQLSTLFPRVFDYRKGIIFASIVSFLICPWKLMENQDSIYLFLDIIGAIMGPIAGTMICHFYIIDKQQIDLPRLYDRDSVVYNNDVNAYAYVSTILGAILPIACKFIPQLAAISSIAWFVGFIIAFVSYYIMAGGGRIEKIRT